MKTKVKIISGIKKFCPGIGVILPPTELTLTDKEIETLKLNGFIIEEVKPVIDTIKPIEKKDELPPPIEPEKDEDEEIIITGLEPINNPNADQIKQEPIVPLEIKKPIQNNQRPAGKLNFKK